MKSCEQASILWHGTVHHLDIPGFDRRSISMKDLTLTSLRIILEKAVDDASCQAATCTLFSLVLVLTLASLAHRFLSRRVTNYGIFFCVRMVTVWSSVCER